MRATVSKLRPLLWKKSNESVNFLSFMCEPGEGSAPSLGNKPLRSQLNLSWPCWIDLNSIREQCVGPEKSKPIPILKEWLSFSKLLASVR